MSHACFLTVHALIETCYLRRKLSEAEFWMRYFQSRLFNAHRASIRSSATQHVVKDDPIFDKYLEKDDDGMFYLFGLSS
jgi:hypothetical protein